MIKAPAGAAAQRGSSVNVIEDVTEVKRAELAQRFLAQAGARARLLARLRADARADRRARRAAARRLVRVTHADAAIACGRVAVAHVDPAKVALRPRVPGALPDAARRADGAAHVLRDGTSQRRQRHHDELLAAGRARTRSSAAAARRLGMRAVDDRADARRGRRRSASITFASAESGRSFSEDDLELAEELGRRAGTAVENARLYRERSHIARHAAARAAARRAAARSPACGSRRSTARPGEENLVGGDFYDAFPTADGLDAARRRRHRPRRRGRRADRAGAAHAAHGGPTAARRSRAPRCEQLNQTLADAARAHAVHGRDRPCHRRRPRDVFCAGHPQPLLIRGGEPRAVGRFGPMLGAWSDSRWQPESLVLEPGDVLVLYTDGVTDAEGEQERFGDERLLGRAARRDGRRRRRRRHRSRAERVPGGSAGRRHRRAGTRPTGQSCLTCR